MRILYFCSYFQHPVGQGTHAREFLRACDALPGITCIPAMSLDVPKGQSTAGVPHRGVGAHLPLWLYTWLKLRRVDAQAWTLLQEAVKREQPDWLLIRYELRTAPLLPLLRATFPKLRICCELNAYMAYEGLALPVLSAKSKRYEDYLLSHVDRITAVSSIIKQDLIAGGFAAEHIIVNPNGVRWELFNDASQISRDHARSRFDLPQKKLLLGYVGGLERFRSLPKMLRDVHALALDVDQPLCLVFAGDGKALPELKALADTFDGAPEVRFLGFVDHAEVPLLMKALDIGLFPYSNHYGSPMKVFEYAAAGIPFVGPANTPMHDAFTPGEHYVEVAETGHNFRGGCQQLIEDPEAADAMGERARMHVEAHYTWTDNARRVVDLLQDA